MQVPARYDLPQEMLVINGCCTCPSWTCADVSVRAVCRLRAWVRFALIRRSVELNTHPTIYLCICICICEPPMEPPPPPGARP